MEDPAGTGSSFDEERSFYGHTRYVCIAMAMTDAEKILPREMIELIQQYVDGESIYISRKEGEAGLWLRGKR